MYFHCSPNSLFYLLEHTILFCVHDYISSSVLCQHTHSGYFILFSLLSVEAQSAWHGRLQEAGTAHLGHKLKTSRSQNTTAASSLTLCPGSLWRSGAKWWCWGWVSAVPKSLPSCSVSSAEPGHSTAVPFILSSCRASLRRYQWVTHRFSALLDPGD